MDDSARAVSEELDLLGKQIGTYQGVSVVIPAYNAAHSIADAIGSALRVLGCRIIVVDDGSCDQTGECAASAGATVITQRNSGARSARLKGLAEITTEVVVFLDSDDILLPGMAEAVHKLLRTRQLDVVGGPIAVRAGRRRQRVRVSKPPIGLTLKGLLARSYSPWPQSAAAWRTESLRRAMAEPPAALSTRYAEDFELLLRMALRGNVGAVSTPTCLYRMDGGKSARNAVDAVADSESIRGYYSRYAGLCIAQLTSSQIADQAAWRYLRSRQAEVGSTRALTEALLHPHRFLSITRYQLRQRVSAGAASTKKQV
jgi:glycosyltransferase involved in cell wall biosynthesis